MDNISKLEARTDHVADNLAEWESDSIARIARKCSKIGKMSKEEAEAFKADEEAKKEWEKIVAALAAATALNIRSLKKAYTQELEGWHDADRYLYDYRGIRFTDITESKQMQGIIDDYVKQNGKDMLNLTQTKALRVLDRNGNPIRCQDAIYKAFSEAVEYVKDGRADFHTAMRQTIQSLGGGGCRIDYGGGVTRRLDTVVRQNMMWGIKQSHREYNALVGRELGCDGIEIDYHTNSRPSHRYMQGKQYSKTEGKTVNGVFYPSAEKEGVYARLYEDYNCYHYETDIILGVSVPRYTDEELRRFEERDKRLYKIGDIEKDGYGWSQVMRRLETETRKAKDEINALSALGGNQNQIKILRKRIKTYQAKYDEISSVTGIAKDPKRMSVPRAPKKVANGLKNGADGGIIKEVNGLDLPTANTATDIVEQTTGSKMQAPMDISDATIGANPKYAKNTPYGVNCQRCVQAYELRRRGYDVTAKPKPSSNNIITWGSECFIQPGTYQYSRQAFTLNQTENSVKKVFANAPDGSRFAVYVKWQKRYGGNAHVFIAEKSGGVVRYLDPQIGNLDVSNYFSMGTEGFYGYFRMDDKLLTTDPKIIFETVEAKQP